MFTMQQRRGSMYVAVLGCTMAITVIGVGALLATRIEGKSAGGVMDVTAARLYAQSAIDYGMWTIYNDPNWRSTMVNGAWKTDQPIGNGIFSLTVVDPRDGDLSNSDSSPVVLTGIGQLRSSRYLLEATAVARPLPLKALKTCLHAQGSVTVSLLQSVSVTGGALSMNGSINGPGTITGRVEAGSTGVLPIIVGTSEIPSAAKPLPDADVIPTYQSLATAISPGNEIKEAVLAPGRNPYSTTTNADGVYYVNAGANFTIESSRVHGTLIVTIPSGKRMYLKDSVFLHPARADYPTLIVEGDLQVDLRSTSGGLSESSRSVNYNPDGAPYLGVTDNDQTDTYPNEVQGLIHVKGNLYLNESSRVRGAILVEGNVVIGGGISLIHDPDLYDNPPMDYVTYIMQLATGSWRRVVNP